MNRLLYIHGFRSVGLCYKGSIIKQFAPDALTPNLPYPPKLAMALLEDLINSYLKTSQSLCLIGSSLGGYYATYLAEKYQLKAILINPVIDAYKTLYPAIGRVNISYNQKSFLWTKDLLEDLRDFQISCITPTHYLVLLQKGDKILDYKIAASFFSQCQLVIEEKGSHHFDNFESKKDLILSFANF